MKNRIQSICRWLADWLIDPALNVQLPDGFGSQHVELGSNIAWRTSDGEWQVFTERNGFRTDQLLFSGDLKTARELFR